MMLTVFGKGLTRSDDAKAREIHSHEGRGVERRKEGRDQA